MFDYDVIVIGGGHAGVEAAYIAANLGAKTLLVTSSQHSLGATSCNPAIGGIGKTHIVHEIDICGGIMPSLADESAIHYRILNKKKGKAVQSIRVQIDKELYSSKTLKKITNINNLKIIYDEADSLIIKNDTIEGITINQQPYHAPSVIITTGTFLGGMIHIGTHQIPAGRFGDKASSALAENIRHYLKTARLKTGTPARLDGRTINWSALEMQPSEISNQFVSRGTSVYHNPQISCGITYTNEKTHKIIEDNLHLSSVYSGQIGSKGPRYCPSIEDKIYRFRDKQQHQIFVEPEGLKSYSVYPNGISTALPEKVQDQYLRSIKGFENVSIIRYGYAIEYQTIDPRELYHTLETRKVKGLFLAGQINGTTGYEEAAGQGVAAGINAVLSLDKKEYIFSRASSYIGVMIDDLVTKGIDEPYRMFTSRSEFRTLLRSDNAALRLKNVPRGTSSQKNNRIRFSYYFLKEIIQNTYLSPSLSKELGIPMPSDGRKHSLYFLLSHPIFKKAVHSYLYKHYNSFKEILPILIADGEYQTYTNRLVKFQQEVKDQQDFNIPQGFNFKSIEGVSNEIAYKLNDFAPRSFSELKQQPYVTPAAFLVIIRYFKNNSF